VDTETQSSHPGVSTQLLAWRALAYPASQTPENLAGVVETNRIAFRRLKRPPSKIYTLSPVRSPVVSPAIRVRQTDIPDCQACGRVIAVTIGPGGSPGKEIRARSARRRQKVPIASAAALKLRVVERTERLVPEEPSPASPRTKIRSWVPEDLLAAVNSGVNGRLPSGWAKETEVRFAADSAGEGGFEPSVPRETDNAFRDCPCSTIPEIKLPRQRTGSFARGTDGSNPAFRRVDGWRCRISDRVSNSTRPGLIRVVAGPGKEIELSGGHQTSRRSSPNEAVPPGPPSLDIEPHLLLERL
jgi:hypothetical protein